MMNIILRSAVGALALVCSGAPAIAADVTRGQALHDTFCIACHEPTVYERADRIANGYAEIRQQVQRWQNNARLRWTQSDIDAVTEFLDQKYYSARP